MTDPFRRKTVRSGPPCRPSCSLHGRAGLGLGAVYDWFCRVTGFGGVTNVAFPTDADDEILDQTMTVPLRRLA